MTGGLLPLTNMNGNNRCEVNKGYWICFNFITLKCCLLHIIFDIIYESVRICFTEPGVRWWLSDGGRQLLPLLSPWPCHVQNGFTIYTSSQKQLSQTSVPHHLETWFEMSTSSFLCLCAEARFSILKQGAPSAILKRRRLCKKCRRWISFTSVMVSDH